MADPHRPSLRAGTGSAYSELGNTGTITVTDGTNTATYTPTGPEVSGVPISPLVKRVTVTWETATGAILTVPAGEVWLIDSVHAITTVEWNGSMPALDVGVVGGDTDGYIDGAVLTANGSKGDAADERGAELWDAANGHQLKHQLAAGQQVGVVVTPGSGASAGTTVVYVVGWILPL